jgi:hypothetical protein
MLLCYGLLCHKDVACMAWFGNLAQRSKAENHGCRLQLRPLLFTGTSNGCSLIRCPWFLPVGLVAQRCILQCCSWDISAALYRPACCQTSTHHMMVTAQLSAQIIDVLCCRCFSTFRCVQVRWSWCPRKVPEVLPLSCGSCPFGSQLAAVAAAACARQPAAGTKSVVLLQLLTVPRQQCDAQPPAMFVRTVKGRSCVAAASRVLAAG